MSRSVLLFALSIVLSLSFVLYSPVVIATSPVNLTVTTYTGQSYLNINQSDRLKIRYNTNIDYGFSPPNIVIYIPPNNATSTDNEPYFIVDVETNESDCSACGVSNSNAIDAGYINGKVVNLTFDHGVVPIAIIDITFNATPINPQALLYTNWTGLIDTDTYSTQTPFLIRPPHLTISDNPSSQSRTVYLEDNLTIGEMIIFNSDSQDYTGDAYNVTATADNLTNNLEILSNKTIDVTDNLSSGESTYTGQWTINAKSIGLSDISITAKDQTGDYNDTINVTINIVNLTVTPAILEENPKIGERITILANITDNASDLDYLNTKITANITYNALNTTSGNIDNYTDVICLDFYNNSKFIYNPTLSGTGYTVFTCDTYILERSGLYNLTISVNDTYEYYNGSEDITKYKYTTNTSNFTVSFGKLNITNTFAMMLAVNDSFDNPQGFWQYGEDGGSQIETSVWSYDSVNGIMKKTHTNNDQLDYNIITALPESTDLYIEVDVIDDIKTFMGITFRYNSLSEGYRFYHSFSNLFSIEKLGDSSEYPDIIASGTYSNITGNHKLSVYMVGNELIGLVDNQVVARGYDSDPIPSGAVGIFSDPSPSITSIFDNFKVYNILNPKYGLLNGQPFELRSFTEVIDGDIWGPTNYTLSIADSKIENISNLQFSNTSNLKKGTTQIINWTLETKELGDTNLTIDITPTYGTKTTNEINTTIVPLFTYPMLPIRNYGQSEILYINVTGFGPSLQGPNGMFSASIKQEYIETAVETTNFNFHTDLSDIDNGYYVYLTYYTTTQMSGIYDLNFTMGNQYNTNITNTTESFFINYGTLDILFDAGPSKITRFDSDLQDVYVSASGGDVRNITLNFTSLTPTILDLYVGENSNRTETYILNGNLNKYSWNLSAKLEGYANLSVSANATYGGNATENKYNLEITTGIDEEAPKILNVSLEYDIVNLKENITIYANVTDNYGVHTVVTQIFYPNLSSYSENYTMAFNPNTKQYYFTFPNTTILTNNTEFYNIQVYANDSKSLLNASDNTTTFNTTNKYTIGTDYLNHDLFNLGEDVISTVPVYTVNNNPITDFNLTLLMKKQGEENDTVLLPNNQTNTYTYNINASDPIGLYNLDMNVSKDGNTANLSGIFGVSNIYSLDFIQPNSNFREQQPQVFLYNSASPLINILNARGEQVESWGAEVWITCAQTSNISLLINKDWGRYVDTGDVACQMPSTLGPFNILAFVNDIYNNSGSSSIQMTIQEYTAPPAAGDSGGTSSPPSSSSPPPQDPTNYSSYEKRTEFFFYTDMRDLNMIQGEIRDMTFSLDNTGDYDLNITTSYELDDLTIEINNSYFVKSKNKQSIPIKVISTLSDQPKTYFLKLKMTQGEIVKEETVTIELEKNQLIYDLEDLEQDLLRINNTISDMDHIGINTKPYQQQLELSKQLLQSAKVSIASNNITSLNLQTTQLSDSLKSLDSKLIENEQIRWLFENKQNIAGIILSTIILLFLLKEYIYPLIFLSIKIQRLKSKKSLLEAEEKSTEKEYFTRVIDKITFNKIITEKHNKLTEIRTQLVRMNKSLKRLMHGHRIKSEDLGKRHNLRQKIRLTFKSIFKPKSLKQPSLKKINNPLSNLRLRLKSKTQPTHTPKTIAPIDLAEKAPTYPQGNLLSSKPEPQVESIIPEQVSNIESSKNRGDEMCEIHDRNDTKENPKESFNDIKKKINNIFDD